ncbi:putative quinol monooxygenase [Roseibium sp. SCPC15]|uniref:putative quinol monooxygenase n=1 Tax=Roseibium sp. SCP15 TaxID=3141376 RepID=UPI00333CD576
MFAVTVCFQIKEGQLDEFLPLMIENAQTSLKAEPGCRQFDVCTDDARPGEIFLYEIYDDATAFQVHLASEHFLKFDSEVSSMVADKKVATYSKVTS